jgi:thermitase
MLLAFALLIPSAVMADDGGGHSAPDSGSDWIIQLNDDVAGFMGTQMVSSFLGDASQRELASSDRTLVVSFEGETRASDAIARLMSHPAVDFVEPDILYYFQETFVPDDVLFIEQIWAETVNLPAAWTVTAGDPDVIVSVVDSGIRADHPDLEGQVLTGKNYVDGFSEDDTSDNLGHGTAVAGIIAAVGNNGIGVAGTAMNVQLLPMRVGNTDGVPISRIALAVEDSVNMGADVINLSLGSETQSARLEQALGFAEANDVIVVAASGNQPDKVSFPGSSPSTISVGASSLDGTDLTRFTSRVSVTDLVAPGEGVVTTYYTPDQGNGYATVQGTSFSTPIVTGAAALIKSVNPDLDVHQVRTLLRETAQMTFAEGTAGTGSGLLDVNAAVREALLPSFGATWLREDAPVYSGQTVRSWLWGPDAFDMLVEPYAESENGYRLTAYFDKARMEIIDPYGDRTTPWFVTNGLLVNELISGQMQVGDSHFVARTPADVPVAGDPDNNSGPTYATFNNLSTSEGVSQGSAIIATLDQAGNVGSDDSYAAQSVTSAEFVPETGYTIASVFWDYLNSTGTLRLPGQYFEGRVFDPTFFATGLPVTEAYWSRVTVANVEQDVLIQCFERRCLTYTPANDPEWQVEMGNVGQHYYRWRYGDVPDGPAVQNPSDYAVNNLR